jgi:two-component system, NarL family, sensor kinase
MPDPLKRLKLISHPLGQVEALDLGPERVTDPDRRFRSLALAALDKQQFERGRLARMLHDDVAQLLSGAGLQLDILRMDLELSVPGIGSRTAEIQELLDRVVRQVRELSYKLNPDIVGRAGLQPALDLLIGRLRKTFTGTLRLVYDSSLRLPVTAAVAMERIAEEAAANALRHAHCSKIEITMSSTREGPKLQVRDNGTGFDYDQERISPRGLGLPMMEYWAAGASLRLTIVGNAAKGAVVTVVAPGLGR